ncbi:guanine nucleotide-binding protein subunit gamma [Coniosporium apollinis CBS 100218]|uniref:Guanine nucleotide-binding protein subunit gamma n=1 Tax=Coniosporium apollinis (strain CBS 100218) TaxID=1168221 RepID=R7YMR0_CONA1|nr:guanine nucleotide-binding protein subunit gamma [Coniosporium apollinis CBS 100218]EON63187.1 guanine nucleotide-binding protein subunit gamma [Coniosporium apollinis CBS 100218]
MMSTPYELRTGGDGKSKKQSMAELKLRRLTELNARLKEDLERRRIPVSEAAMDLIAFCDKEPKDYMVPSRWGTVDKREDPYAPQQGSTGCCIVM